MRIFRWYIHQNYQGTKPYNIYIYRNMCQGPFKQSLFPLKFFSIFYNLVIFLSFYLHLIDLWNSNTKKIKCLLQIYCERITSIVMKGNMFSQWMVYPQNAPQKCPCEASNSPTRHTVIMIYICGTYHNAIGFHVGTCSASRGHLWMPCGDAPDTTLQHIFLHSYKEKKLFYQSFHSMSSIFEVYL